MIQKEGGGRWKREYASEHLRAGLSAMKKALLAERKQERTRAPPSAAREKPGSTAGCRHAAVQVRFEEIAGPVCEPERR
jgi:hypothetical protein